MFENVLMMGSGEVGIVRAVLSFNNIIYPQSIYLKRIFVDTLHPLYTAHHRDKSYNCNDLINYSPP